jgi:predicted DNA-binding transcriptional regulator AlpA
MQVYRFRELKGAGVPFTRKHVTTLEKRSEFPQHFNLTDFTVVWIADEVDAWVAEKVRAHRADPRVTRRHKAIPGQPKRKAASSEETIEQATLA